MGFESYRQGAFTRRLADLPDQPNMQAAELKTYFDSSPEELRQALAEVGFQAVKLTGD